jgi:hypothetical protein
VICFTPNAMMASGVKVSNAEANYGEPISRQIASILSGVRSSSVRVFDIFYCPSTGCCLAHPLCGLQLTSGGVGGIAGWVLKAIAAFGAALWMMFTTVSNSARLLGGSRRPPPITT